MKLRTTVINVFYLLLLFFYVFMVIKSDINKVICILFVHLFTIMLENFKDRALIIPEIWEFIELHTYNFGLVCVSLYEIKCLLLIINSVGY